jgi:hypothetical protein
MKKAIATGDYQVIEGIVSDFIPMPISGHPSESFSVGGVPLRYGAGWDCAQRYVESRIHS